MKITVITPTCDRPVGFALAESFMARQTIKPNEWIVADGGSAPANCTMGQIHIHDPSPAGAANFARNLLNGIARASGDIIVTYEDDDLYLPDHLATMLNAFVRTPRAWLAGDDSQRYYNVAKRCWRIYKNMGASMCQTAMRKALLPQFESTIKECVKRNTYGIDTTFWRSVPRNQWALTGKMTVLGIKGLPGQAGLGVGHRPTSGWMPDPDLAQLRQWIGDDASRYAEFRELAVA